VAEQVLCGRRGCPYSSAISVSPLVIGGSDGSGATTVARLFTRAGRYMGHELTPAGDAADLAEFEWIWGLRYLERDAASPEMVDAFSRAVERHLHGRLDSRQPWGWKSSHGYLLIPFLAERFEELRFIHVIRDARAIELACNYRQLDRYGALAGITDDGEEFARALHFWGWANQWAAQAGDRLLGGRYLAIRFEDLCNDPERTIARMMEFSGDPADDRLSSFVGPLPELGRGASLPVPRIVSAALNRFGYATVAPSEASEEAARIANVAAELERLLGPVPERASWPRVSAIVPTHDGRELVERLLHGLMDRTDYPELEVVVVDNASSDGTRQWLERQPFPFPVVVVRNPQDVSFSESINLGVSRSTGELLLFLNNDVEPIEPGWLRRLVVTLEAPAAAISGAVLVDPDRRSVSGRRVAVQHAGVAFGRDGAVLRPLLLGLGDDVFNAVGPDRQVPAVAAACSLIGRRDFDAVGGFYDGFRYGGEDIDLCLALARRGGHSVISGSAVLLHWPLSTRRSAPAGVAEVVHANHTVLLERWGPAIRREYALDCAHGRRSWNGDGGVADADVSFCVKPSVYTTEAELSDLVAEIEAAGHPARAVDATDAWLLDDVVVHLFDGVGRHAIAPGRLNVLFARRGRPLAGEAAPYDLVVGSESSVAEVVRAAEEALARHGGPSRGRPAVQVASAAAPGRLATPRRAVVVLGMARTGTSATMRILNILGVALGPEERLLGAIDDINAKGFFEHYAIMRLNTELLRRLGGSWSKPPPLPPGWESDSALDDLREQASAILERDFAGESLWGFKDPRTCLTLPFWRPLIGPASFVVCHRHPLEIAASLEQRDGLTIDASLALWRRYTASALAATAGERRAVVVYRTLLVEPVAACEKLAALLGYPERGADPGMRSQVESWIEPDLRHHMGELTELLTDPRINRLDLSLALLLELAGSVGPAGEHEEGVVNEALDAAAGELLEGMTATAAQVQ